MQNDEKTRRKDAREDIAEEKQKSHQEAGKQERPMYMMWGTMGAKILAALVVVGRWKERTQAKPAGRYQHNRQFDTMQWCREKHQKNSHHRRSHFHLLPLNFLHRKPKEPVDIGIKGWPLA